MSRWGGLVSPTSGSPRRRSPLPSPPQAIRPVSQAAARRSYALPQARCQAGARWTPADRRAGCMIYRSKRADAPASATEPELSRVRPKTWATTGKRERQRACVMVGCSLAAGANLGRPNAAPAPWAEHRSGARIAPRPVDTHRRHSRRRHSRPSPASARPISSGKASGRP